MNNIYERIHLQDKTKKVKDMILPNFDKIR